MSLACPSIIEGLSPRLCRAVDLYCERTGPGYDAELLNTFTNLAFFIAAFFAMRLYSRMAEEEDRWLTPTMIVLTAFIGVGSFFLHTTATAWAQWGDVIPIMLFMLLYLWFVLTRYFGWPAWASLLAVSGFLGVTLYLESAVSPTFLWGGAMYLPALATILVIAVAMLRLRLEAGQAMFVAVAVFGLSFLARSVDVPICQSLPVGTHFLWHLLNALLLYLLIRIAIIHGLPRARARL